MLPGTALYNQLKFVGTESPGRAQAPEIMSVLLGDKCCHWHCGGGKRSVAGPALIGCISIIIAVRPPLPIWLSLLPCDWLRRHSSAIYKLPQRCFFSFFPPTFATSVFFFSLPGPNKRHCVCVCVFHVLSLLQQCANTKGAESSGRVDWNQERERRYIYTILNIWIGEKSLQLYIWNRTGKVAFKIWSDSPGKKAQWQEKRQNGLFQVRSAWFYTWIKSRIKAHTLSVKALTRLQYA